MSGRSAGQAVGHLDGRLGGQAIGRPARWSAGHLGGQALWRLARTTGGWPGGRPGSWSSGPAASCKAGWPAGGSSIVLYANYMQTYMQTYMKTSGCNYEIYICQMKKEAHALEEQNCYFTFSHVRHRACSYNTLLILFTIYICIIHNCSLRFAYRFAYMFAYSLHICLHIVCI